MNFILCDSSREPWQGGQYTLMLREESSSLLRRAVSGLTTNVTKYHEESPRPS